MLESPLIPILGVFLIMYFVMIKPQIDEQRAHTDLLAGLAKDDLVVTKGGLWGTVQKVEGEKVVLDLGSKNRVTVDKSAIERRGESPASKD